MHQPTYTCQIAVDGLKMRPVLVVTFAERVPNDVCHMLDQGPDSCTGGRRRGRLLNKCRGLLLFFRGRLEGSLKKPRLTIPFDDGRKFCCGVKKRENSLKLNGKSRHMCYMELSKSIFLSNFRMCFFVQVLMSLNS